MPPQTRRATAIRKNLDHVAGSTYRFGDAFQTAQDAIAYVRAGQRLCIDAIPTEPVLQVKVRRRPNDAWNVFAKTTRRTLRFGIHKVSYTGRYMLFASFNTRVWYNRINRRIAWRRRGMVMEMLALAMHPRAGRDSPVYRATQHPLFDRNVFVVLLNQALGRLPHQRNRLE